MKKRKEIECPYCGSKTEVLYSVHMGTQVYQLECQNCKARSSRRRVGANLHWNNNQTKLLHVIQPDGDRFEIRGTRWVDCSTLDLSREKVYVAGDLNWVFNVKIDENLSREYILRQAVLLINEHFPEHVFWSD